MKKILKMGGTNLYIKHCDKCGCEFSYEDEDIVTGFDNSRGSVLCPECNHVMTHMYQYKYISIMHT